MSASSFPGLLVHAINSRRREVLREHDCQSLVDHIRHIEAELNKIGDATGAPRIKSIFDSVPTLETRYYAEGQSSNKTFAVSDSLFDNCVEFDCVLRLKP